MRKQINRLFATILAGTTACLLMAGCASKKVNDPNAEGLTGVLSGEENLFDEDLLPDDGMFDGGMTIGGGMPDGGEIDGGMSLGGVGAPAVLGSGLPDDVQQLFDLALQGHKDSTLTPVCLLGTEVTAGTVYEILCIEEKGEKERLALADLSVGLDGTASLASVRKFDALNLKEKEGTDGMPLDGGFTVTETELTVELPPAVRIALLKAKAGLEDTEVEVMAYLGSQIVAGMKYRFLCRVTDNTEGASPKLCYAAVYEDLGGNASFVDLYEIELP